MSKVYPLAGLATRYVARLNRINVESVQEDGQVKFFDQVDVEDEDGDVWDSVCVESTEDELPYRDALAESGWTIVGTTLTGAWRVRRS